jgi:hypothetical protein
MVNGLSSSYSFHQHLSIPNLQFREQTYTRNGILINAGTSSVGGDSSEGEWPSDKLTADRGGEPGTTE